MPSNIQPGEVIGLFQIVEENKERAKDGHKLYRVRCVECGREFVYSLHDIKRPKVCQHVGRYGYKSYSRASIPKLKSIYGKMTSRCENENDNSYRYYGAKGISVCEEWHDYLEFERWSISHGYEEGLTIDRIDPTDNYCPENCRWVNREFNSRFKSTTNVIEVNGIVMSGKQWSERLGLGINEINRKIRERGIEYTKRFIKERIDANSLV